MKALVTGGDGLLGGHLVRQLLAKGLSVRVLVYPGSTSPTLEGLDIERVDGDLTGEPAALADAVRGCDYVLHCAAITDPFAPAELTWDVNLEGTRKIVDACLAERVARLVFVGSASSFAFGSLEQPGHEGNGFPETYRGVDYMESKHQAMKLVSDAVATRGLDAVVVAPTFMLGDGDWRPSSGELIRQFVSKGFSLVPPGGRSFAYAKDVAAAMVAALERAPKGEVYLLGGANLTYRDFFSRVAEQAGVGAPRGTLPGAAVTGAGALGSLVAKLGGPKKSLNRTMARLAQCGAYYSSDKAVRELGYPQTPVEVGISDTLRCLVDYGHLAPRPAGPFHGKVALITGASRGVGFATAKALALRGARVVISARGQQRLAKAHAQLEALGGQVESIVGDVGRWEDARDMVTAALTRFGRLDILVANAGVSMRGQFSELAPDVCDATIRTNLLGSVYPARAAVDELKRTRGQVIFVSSIAGLMGLPGASTYCASKGALTGLVESLRLELIPHGVNCGIVYLGFTEHDPEKRILAADGSAVRPDRPAHHSQAYAAGLILEMLEKRKRQLIMTPIGGLGALAHRLSPSFVEWTILRAQQSQWGVFKSFS